MISTAFRTSDSHQRAFV